MEYFENNDLNKEPTAEEIEQLLQESYELIGRIIKDHNTVEDIHAASVSVTTPEAEMNDKLGYLSVVDLNGNEFEITINENHYTDSQESTTEVYKLLYISGTGGYELFTTDTRPYVTDDEKLRSATPAEIQRLAYVLEIGAFGYVPFDFEEFEKRFREHPDK